MQRIYTLLVGLGLLGAAHLTVVWQQPVFLQVADRLLGETWYRIELEGRHVGFMHNHAFKDLYGQYQFNTTTHFRMQAGNPNTISKTLEFAPQHNYQLVTANYINRAQQQMMTVTVTSAEMGPDQPYVAQINNAGHSSVQSLDWQFALRDFVELETWLASEQPAPGSQRFAKNPDFERMTISQQGFRIAGLNEQGYLLENDAPLAAHQIQLDHNFRPQHLFMSGTFRFVATHQSDAINLDSASTQTTYLFPTNRRIEEHTQLASLDLEFLSATDLGMQKKLTVVAEAASQAGAPQDFTGAELRYPISLQEVQAIVSERLQSNRQTDNLALDLVTTTYRLLRYSANQPAGSVVEALRRGAGECTDFADLYTTLARAAGLPARTVYGLAYRDGPQPGFGFHAWNEVYFDEAWHALDPTWNQTRVDASHIRLNDSQAGALMLADSLDDLTIQVVDMDYFSS